MTASTKCAAKPPQRHATASPDTARDISGSQPPTAALSVLRRIEVKALYRVSLDPSRITKIAAAALVLPQLEYDRTI
jgi:hypothetical protein